MALNISKKSPLTTKHIEHIPGNSTNTFWFSEAQEMFWEFIHTDPHQVWL